MDVDEGGAVSPSQPSDELPSKGGADDNNVYHLAHKLSAFHEPLGHQISQQQAIHSQTYRRGRDRPWLDQLTTELPDAEGVAETRGEDIGTLQARISNAHAIVESQSAELANIRTLLPKPDTVVDIDVIKFVGRLNAEIFQAAALLAEACSSVKVRPLQGVDNRTASTRFMEMFGSKFVDLVQNVPHENNPAVLRIAFQGCIVVFADWISAAWSFQADPAPQFFGELYRNVWLDGMWFQSIKYFNI